MRIFNKLLLLSLLAVAGFLIGCGQEAVLDEQGGRPPGVSDEEIRIGASLPLSGHAQYLGIQTLRGAMAYLAHVNEQGGVHGRKISLVAYDDAYDPPRCLANTQKLIIEDQVFALSCYVGTPTTVKIIPLVDQAAIPLVGMFTGANDLRVPFNRYLINVRPSYYKETEEAVRHMVEDLGLSKIAVFYQYDAYGFDGLTGTELALKNYGLAPIAKGNYIRGTDQVDEGLDKIASSGAEAVFMIGTYEVCATFVHKARARGFDPLFYHVSFVGAEELARRLEGEEDALVLMSQVVPPPMQDQHGEGHDVADYANLLSHYYPQDKPNYVGLEAFLNARVLVEGLRRAGPNLTREKFIDAIESMRDYALMNGISVIFGPADHQGLDQVYFTKLTNGSFAPIKDWSELRSALIEKRGPAESS
jgi:ABC-type branched-subunit amino acid transport system substrate-binding protein